MKYILPLLLIVGFYPLFSQHVPGYVPMPAEPTNSKALLSEIHAGHQKTLSKIAGNKSEYKTFYNDRHEFVKSSIENGHFLFEEQSQLFFKNILLEIYRANPVLPQTEIRLFQGRFPTPNASSLGDGNLIMNVGLLAQLENESQLAFILCHEIAHYILEHAESSLDKYIW